jgi:hypothetical protein
MQNKPLTDSELNEICASGRPGTGRFEESDMTFYFETWFRTVDEHGKSLKVDKIPSWRRMDPDRMREIFHRALRATWCNEIWAERIIHAMLELDAAAH